MGEHSSLTDAEVGEDPLKHVAGNGLDSSVAKFAYRRA